MEKNDMVRARINDQIKKEANAVLAAIGIDASDAFRMMMTRIATEKALPFDPLIPNEETILAMRYALEGKTDRFNSVDDMMKDLRADD